jgi:acetolactate synthase small subunit
MTSLHTFVAYVEDQPGVLNRIASLFRRRGYNIVSLNVGRTHRPGVSRMTFAVQADEDVAHRIEANLYKLVNVLSVEDITEEASVARDLALIKVGVSLEQRAARTGCGNHRQPGEDRRTHSSHGAFRDPRDGSERHDRHDPRRRGHGRPSCPPEHRKRRRKRKRICDLNRTTHEQRFPRAC